MRKCILLACFILEIFMLVGCGVKDKTEEEILADILVEEEIFSRYIDLEVTEFVIVERRTDKNEKTDVIEFSLQASNEDISFALAGNLYYYLYEQGWKLDMLDETNRVVLPLRSSISQEMANTVAESLTSQYIMWEAILNTRNTNLENGTDNFFYIIKDTRNLYWTEEYGLMVNYKFDEVNGWTYDTYSISEIGGHWNKEALCGTWRTTQAGYSGYFEISIYDINEKDGLISASIECDFTSIAAPNPIRKQEYGEYLFNKKSWECTVYQGTVASYAVELNKANGVIFAGKHCEKVEEINPARTDNYVDPIEELAVNTSDAYNELLEQIANQNDYQELQKIILSKEYEEMCRNYLDMLTEDCVIYEGNKSDIILHFMSVPESDVVVPYSEYMIWCYNWETEEGKLVGKCRYKDSVGVYVAIGKWAEVFYGAGTEYRTGYCPQGENTVWVSFDNGFDTCINGYARNGVWNVDKWDNCTRREFYIEDGSYGEYRMYFFRGFLQNVLDDEGYSTVCIWHDAVNETSYRSGEYTHEQRNPYGILGFGEAFF